MDKGAHYHRCDFQVHSPRDHQWKGEVPVAEADRKAFARDFVEACVGKGLDAVAITDHHDMLFAGIIRDVARDMMVQGESSIHVFPGIELTLGVPCQALLLLDADFPTEQFDLVLASLAIDPAPREAAKGPEVRQLAHIHTFEELCAALDQQDRLRGRYIVLPNVSQGGQHTLIRKGMASKYRSMPCVGGYVDGPLNRLAEGQKSILAGNDGHWGPKRIGIIQTSDSRSAMFEALGSHSTWIKWAQPTAEALRQACLAQESRLAHKKPILPATRITGISVNKSRFLGQLALELNPQLNAVIGGRGTGKSTLLEYIRWALCDQPPSFGDDGELPDFQKRRHTLIERTLKPLSGVVEVSFVANDTPHTVRRRSETGEVQLKFGDGTFETVSEHDVRSIVNIQAYSQKQLSSVGVRIDELKRFVQAPIHEALTSIRSTLDSLASEMRSAHAEVVRKRRTEQALRQERLSLESLTEQAESLRRSLPDLDEADRAIIAQRSAYELAGQRVETVPTQLELVRSLLDDLVATAEIPVDESALDEAADIPQTEVIATVEREAHALLDKVRGTSQELAREISEAMAEEGVIGRELGRWAATREEFEEKYEAAKTKSSAHATQLSNLKQLESRIQATRRSIREKETHLAPLAQADAHYQTLRGRWYDLHVEKANIVEEQCRRLTNNTNHELRASLHRHAGVSDVLGKLQEAARGSGVRSNTITALVTRIHDADEPLVELEQQLQELERLAAFDVEVDDESEVPDAPILSMCGATEVQVRGIAKHLSIGEWLDLALSPVDDEPIFHYELSGGEVIDFADASAGQQATALLKALLNEPGPPLLIDQPEEDLDNPVITEVVDEIWTSKKRRQLIITSHNANLVVNGDAELVVCCDYRTGEDHSAGRIANEGAIDIEETRETIKSVMEGGEKAFRLRKEKYGF